MASLVVVSVLVVILTLISLGFARLMTRSSIDSTNRQLGNAANYAAQSGINDVISYMKQYATDHPSSPYVSSPECTGSNSLIGSTGNPGPFYNDSNLSGDTSRNNQYSCILLNQTPSDLVYSGLPEAQSQVVKMTTSAVTGAMDKVMLSWKPSNALLTGYPPSNLSLLDEATWTDPINSYMPILRVTIYPVPVSGSTANLQANARTFFLYPQAPSPPNNVPVQNYVNISDGQKLPVNCGDTNTNGAFSGTADYRCNLIINNLLNSVSSPGGDPINYVYLRLTPIYGQLDVKIQANDKWGQSLKFINVQAVVDVTAKVANVSKRLQARVNISSTSTTTSNNISPASNDIPEFSLRSSDALCKRLTVHSGPYYSYITPDAPDNICHTGIVVPTPALTFSITGNNGRDNGLTVDSEANNPDSPQNPVQKGTVYIDSAATLRWHTSDATSCQASGNWNGQKLDPPTTWSNTVQADGSQGVTGITTVQHYTLSCTGPGSAAPLAKTVTAWPPPTALVSGPSSDVYIAGTSFTLSWSANNANLCQFTGNWPDASPRSNPSGAPMNGSQTVTTDWDDTTSKTYTTTCSDPSGRTAMSTYKTRPTWPTPTVSISGPRSINAGDSLTLNWSVGNSSTCTSSGSWPTPFTLSGLKGTPRNGSQTIFTSWNDNSTQTYRITCVNPGGSNFAIWTVGPGGNTNKNPPPCHASAHVHDNGDGTAYPVWSGTCPDVSPGSGYYSLYSSTDSSWNISGHNDTSRGGVADSGSGFWLQLGPGYHCVGLTAGADPWGWLADSGQDCQNIVVPPVSVDLFSVGDLVYYKYNNGGCVYDGLHPWAICNIAVEVHQAGTRPSQLHCTLQSDGYNVGSWRGPDYWLSNDLGSRFHAPTYGSSHSQIWNDGPTWALGYYGNAYTYFNVLIGWYCWSDRGGQPANPSIYRYSQNPPPCDYGGEYPLCNSPPPPPPPPPPSGGGGGGSGGGGGGGCGLDNNLPFYPELGIMSFYFARVIYC